MTTPFPQQQTPSSQPGRDPRSVPDVEVPISGNPAHPVNAPGVSVYYSRTDNLVGLNTEQQTQALVDAMRSTGPGKVLLLEANGPRDGSYVEELRRALPAALEQVPADQRPEIRLFISDGRPVVGSPNNQGQPYNDFAAFLQNLDAQRPNSGTVQIDSSQAVPRAVPNWNNPEVVDFYLRERVQPAVDLAKELGIRTVVIDDHIGVPPGANMNAFKRVNGLDDRGATNVITSAYDRALSTIENAGLQTGLSAAAEPQSTLRFGIDMARLAPRADIVEIQGYRETPGQVQAMADRLYENVRDNFDRYRGVDEFKIALATRANGQNLTEDTLIAQQRTIDRLEDRLGDLYRSRGVEAPQVTTSLWAHQHFHEEATLRQGDQGLRVKELQEALNRAGIRVDGQPLPGTENFRDMTRQAVTQYQQQQGLPATGVADKDTQVALGVYPGLRFAAQEPVQNQPQPQPAPPVNPPVSEPPVTPAPVTPAPVPPQSNPQVPPPAAEQPVNPPPGPVQPQPAPQPGAPATSPTDQTAVPAPVQPAPVTPQPAPQPVPPPFVAPPNEPIASLPPQPQTPAPEAPALQVPAGMYRQDSEGPGVRALQEALNRFGGQLATDGDFGPLTRQAVEQYQRNNGLQVDGIAGPQTIGHLNEALRRGQPAETQPQTVTNASPAAEAVTRDPLFAQAQQALDRLPAGTFANSQERDNMAGALVQATRELHGNTMNTIAEARINERGDGVIALAKGGNDEFQMRSHVGLAQGLGTPLQETGEAMLQKGLAVAQPGMQPPGQQQGMPQETPQRIEQQANPVLMAQNTQPPQEQDAPARGMRV